MNDEAGLFQNALREALQIFRWFEHIAGGWIIRHCRRSQLAKLIGRQFVFVHAFAGNGLDFFHQFEFGLRVENVFNQMPSGDIYARKGYYTYVRGVCQHRTGDQHPTAAQRETISRLHGTVLWRQISPNKLAEGRMMTERARPQNCVYLSLCLDIYRYMTHTSLAAFGANIT